MPGSSGTPARKSAPNFRSKIRTRHCPNERAIPEAFVAARLRHDLGLRFGLQLGVVFLDERPDLVGHGQQLRPLLLVERDREAAEAIDRHAALLADLEVDAATTLALEAFVFGFELLELGPQIFVCHLGSSIRGRRRLSAEPSRRLYPESAS